MDGLYEIKLGFTDEKRFLLEVADNYTNDHIASPIVAFIRSIYRRCTPER